MAGLNVDNFRVSELTAGAALGALVVEGSGLPAWAVGVTFAAVSIVAGFVTRTWLIPILVGLAMFAGKGVWLDPLTDSTADVPALVGVTTTTTEPAPLADATARTDPTATDGPPPGPAEDSTQGGEAAE